MRTVITSFVLAIAAMPALAAPKYTFVGLAPLDTQLGAGQAFSINSRHHVVGNAAASQFAGHAALWLNGKVRDLGTGNNHNAFTASSASKITERGLIVGQSGFKASQPPHAAFYRSGEWIDAGTGYPSPKSFSSFLSANDQGQAAGQRSPLVPKPEHYRRFRTEAFFYDSAGFQTISLGGRNGSAFGINASGVVVGQSETADRTPHAFRWQGGEITDLGTAKVLIAGDQSRARAVNSAGMVVGTGVAKATSSYHAIEWTSTGATDLGALTPKGSAEAEGINDGGVVVGEANDSRGLAAAFVVVDGVMYDLNKITTGLPDKTVLVEATAVAADGTIVGTTCSADCPAGAPRQTAFLLVPTPP